MSEPLARPRPLLEPILLALLIAYHLLRLAVFFGGPDKILSAEPLIRDDHGWHYYYTVTGGRFLRSHGSSNGYDPSLMAGYPTDLFDASDRMTKVIYTLLPKESPAQGYKLTVFIAGLVSPLLLWLIALAFGLARRERLVTTALAVWLWWANLGDNFFALGMVGFLIAAGWGLLVAGCFYRYWTGPSPRRGAVLAAALAAALLIHPGIAPIVVLPCLAVIWVRRRDFKLKTAAGLVLIGAAAAAANLFWLIPQMVNIRWARGSATHLESILIYGGMIRDAVAAGGNLIWLVLLPAAAWGLRTWKQQGRQDLSGIFTWTLAGLLFIAAFGYYFDLLKWTQPARYALPAFFFMLPPAAVGVLDWGDRVRRGAIGRASALPLLLLAIMLVSALRLLAATGSCGPEPAFVGVSPEVARVRDLLEHQTTADHRVLLEDQGPITRVFQHSFPAAYLAMVSDRQIIGGPHWASFLVHHQCDLSGNLLMGRELKSWTGPELERMTRVYNIGWVIASTPLVRKLFDGHPALFVPLEDRGGFKLYRVDLPGTFFLRGQGEVKAQDNRLAISNARPGPEGMVLSYHWHPWLRTDPPRRLYRVPLDDDPVGFIGVEGAGGDFIIRYTYPWEREFWQ